MEMPQNVQTQKLCNPFCLKNKQLNAGTYKVITCVPKNGFPVFLEYVDEECSRIEF